MSKSLLFFLIGNLSLIALTYLTRKRRRLNNVVLLCASLFLFLSIVEMAYRDLVQPKRGRFESSLVFRHDPLLGYVIGKAGAFSSTKYAPDGKIIYHAGYTIVADTNVQWVRLDHRAGFLNPGSPAPGIIFLGCSFTLGEGVDDAETLPYRTGALQHVSTLNLGGIGYGINHVYAIFQDKYAHRNNQKKLFIYTMIPDHVLRAAGLYEWSAGPSFTLAGDSLVYGGPLPEVNKKTAYYASFYGCFSFIKNIVLNFQQNDRFKRVSVQDYQKAYVMIRNMSRYAKATGGDFLLLFWDQFAPENDPNGHFAPVLEKKLSKLQKDGVNLIRVSDIIDTRDRRYYIPGDGHPNALAYDTVARYLASYLPTAFPSYR